MEKTINVGGRLHNPVVGGALTGANEIKDDTKGKMQNVINQETDAELLRLDGAKQEKLTFDQTPTENSINPVTSDGVYAADAALQQAIEAILLLIPSAASALNQLADKSFVNSSIATATATFRGTYNSVADLHLAIDATHQQIADGLLGTIATADNNDYCYVQVPVSATTFDIRRTERYKFNGTAWAYEYDLNTSGYTAEQWAAINSGITQALVGDLVDIKSYIPAEATSLNQLADKAYVVAQIIAGVPAFKGQFTTLVDLQAVQSPKVGDIGIVRTKDYDGQDVFTFYQYLNSQWNVYYTLQRHPQTKPASTGMTGDYPYNGMGCIELPKNIVNGVNTLTRAMMSQTNTKYVIKYDYELGEDITIPANCVLEYDGGSISGAYTITGQNTGIEAGQTKIFGNDLFIGGTWKVPTIYGDWFDTNDANVIARLINLSSDDIQNKIYISNKSYSGSIISEHGTIFLLKSNTTLVLNGTLILSPNALSNYSVIAVGAKKNVTIKGSGSIIGDLEGHTGITEYGHGIIIWESENVTIDGLTITKCNGDGIDFSGGSVPCKDVDISGCYIYECKRQCVTTSYSNGFSIRNCHFDDSSDMGGFGVDIEPNANNYCINGIVENCSFDGNNGLKCQVYSTADRYVNNIVVKNNTFNCDIYSVSNILSDNIIYENNIFKNLTSRTISINSGKNVNIRNNVIGQIVDTTKIAIRVSSACIIENNISKGKIEIVAPYTKVIKNVIEGGISIGDISHSYSSCIISENSIRSLCDISSILGIFTNNDVSGDIKFRELSNVSNNSFLKTIKTGNAIKVCDIDSINCFCGNFIYTEFAGDADADTKLYTLLNVRGNCTINNNTFKIGNNVLYHDYFAYITLNTGAFACINDTKIADFTKKFCNRNLSTGNKVVYKQSGANDEKQSLPIGCIGNKYWDTTNSKELTWNGTAWVDATGTPV